MNSGTRAQMVEHLAEVVASMATGHPTRVAVDGAPASGKTTLADELAGLLRAQGRQIIRATIDDFLFPRPQRYRRGEFSAEANYQDSFDFDALHRVLLDPLGPGGDRKFRRAIRDRVTDTPLSPPLTTAAEDAVLLFDGVFLMRPELNDRWDLRIFVSVTFEQTLARARTRDQAEYGSVAAVERRFRDRYGPSQQFYRATVHPADQAEMVVYNDDPQRPSWEIREG